MMKRAVLISLLALAVLSGCKGDTASYRIGDSRDHALTLIRNKPYPWSKAWELEVVVSNAPVCLRRHRLKDAPEADPELALHVPELGAFILRQGKRWYVAEMGACDLQEFKTPPPEPGELIGSFKTKDGAFRFIAVPAAKP